VAHGVPHPPAYAVWKSGAYLRSI
jgi:hypothetical protein